MRLLGDCARIFPAPEESLRRTKGVAGRRSLAVRGSWDGRALLQLAVWALLVNSTGWSHLWMRSPSALEP